MRISSSTVSNVQALQSQARNERVLQEGARNQARQESEPSVERLGDKERANAFQRRVEFSRSASQSSLSPSREAQDSLPLRNQRAIQAFESNRPTIEQTLGIEIAGIDTYA